MDLTTLTTIPPSTSFNNNNNNPSIQSIPLDSQLHFLLPKIQSHPYLISHPSKHLKIRISSWITILQSIVSNNIWRKNRNNYIRLLYIMLECKQILQPFCNMAPQELPTLHKHQINCILLKLSTRIKQKQKQRDKENKQFRGVNNNNNKVDPNQIWNSLQSRWSKNNISHNNNTVTKIAINNNNSSHKYQNYHNQPITPTSHNHNSKNKRITLQNIQQIIKRNNNNGDSIDIGIGMGIDFLSPISQHAMHTRGFSNLSQRTYSSLQRCRDMLNTQQIHQQISDQSNYQYNNTNNNNVLKQNNINIQQQQQHTHIHTNKTNTTPLKNSNKNNNKQSITNDCVKYFKKNRNIQQLQAQPQPQNSFKYKYNNHQHQHKQKQINQSNLSKQQLYIKIYIFLKKHENNFEQDLQYKEMMEQFTQMLQIHQQQYKQQQQIDHQQQTKIPKYNHNHKHNNKSINVNKKQQQINQQQIASNLQYSQTQQNQISSSSLSNKQIIQLQTSTQRYKQIPKPKSKPIHRQKQIHRQIQINRQINRQKQKKQQNFSELDIDQNSYTYTYDKLSQQYSLIQLDQGISSSRVQNMIDNNNKTSSRAKQLRQPLPIMLNQIQNQNYKKKSIKNQ